MKHFDMMKFLVIIQFSCLSALCGQAPDTLWTRTYGGSYDDFGTSVQQTSDGGYIIAGGSFSYNINIRSDVYLVKTDENGTSIWTKVYGGASDDCGYSVQQTSDSGFVVAGWTECFGAGLFDFYLVKTDANGDTLWTETYGGTSDEEARSVQQTMDGGYIITGYTASFGAGMSDFYLVRTDENGDTLWTRTYGGTDSDCPYSVRQTFDGGFIIVGWSDSFGASGEDFYLVRTDMNGDTIWTKTYGGINTDRAHAVQQTSDSGFIVAGGTCSFGANQGNIYLLKTDKNGDTLWTKMYGGTYTAIGRSVQHTSDSGYIIAGLKSTLGSDFDFYIVRTNPQGDTLWTKTLGGDTADAAYCVQTTSDGGFIVAGETISFGAGNYDVYLIKTEPDPANIVNMEIKNPKKWFAFLEAFPNPCQNSTDIRFEIMQESKKNIELKIHDAAGRTVHILVDGHRTPGSHCVNWDGTNHNGESVPNGVYFLMLKGEGFNVVEKLHLLRN